MSPLKKLLNSRSTWLTQANLVLLPKLLPHLLLLQLLVPLLRPRRRKLKRKSQRRKILALDCSIELSNMKSAFNVIAVLLFS
ncbi:unnamed protein product [Strongylus vulgaris]|uniref:Uncharacterized protein n=1 Tax=Strongylus vulgaris TaxID=40348 RepID=A0A3P7J748_STRVU|nr:unnamed protein product [Strongylus vulgaris]